MSSIDILRKNYARKIPNIEVWSGGMKRFIKVVRILIRLYTLKTDKTKKSPMQIFSLLGCKRTILYF